ncbi:hypothetical protein ABH920_002817 [Catenulispora sp. EB89]|uniref:hypothetical protein n=1 Tax=Catenulispora sp. EB89 TaxID=3156257 RepID=UPI003518BB68
MVTAIGRAAEEEEDAEEGTAELEEDAPDELCRDDGTEGEEGEAELNGEGAVEGEDELCREPGAEPAAG